MCIKALLVYIHGFNSSSGAFKACQLGCYLKEKQSDQYYLVPDLDYQPAVAMAQLEQLVEENLEQYDITLIGSSLGGYYATYLVEKYGVRAVHVNPAIYPYILLEDYLGSNTNLYTNERYELGPEHINQLKQLEIHQVSKPERHLVYLQTADETLDYRDAAEKFNKSWVIIEQGGSHGFENFDQIIPDIMSFAGMDV